MAKSCLPVKYFVRVTSRNKRSLTTEAETYFEILSPLHYNLNQYYNTSSTVLEDRFPKGSNWKKNTDKPVSWMKTYANVHVCVYVFVCVRAWVWVCACACACACVCLCVGKGGGETKGQSKLTRSTWHRSNPFLRPLIDSVFNLNYI